MLEEVNILAVDDTADNLVALRMLLRRPGLKVIEAHSGREALEKLLVHDIALALVDVHMPEMSGFELAELMRGAERTRHIPIIFVTAAVPQGDMFFRGYEAGGVDFLFKPIQPDLLISKVEVFAQLHRQQRQLARHVETLKQAQAMSDLFIGVLGHDIRTPLASIVASAAVIERDSTNTVNVTHSAQIIQRAAARVQRLTQQVLDFALARVKGGIPLEPRPLDFAAVVQQLVADLEPASRARIAVTATGDASGQWDPDRLGQVVTNLLSNAVEHGERGGRIGVAVDGTDERSVALEVHNGGAVPRAALEVIFDPFKPRAGSSGGLGLGLFIVDQIVQAHGGSATVRSSEQEGTTFRIALPRRPSGARAPRDG